MFCAQRSLSGWLVGQVNCCWFLPAQSRLVLGPAGLVTIFLCLTTLGVMQLLSSVWVIRVNCYRCFPAQLLLVPSLVGLMITFFCITTLGVMQLLLLSRLGRVNCYGTPQHSYSWLQVMWDS
jgi:hypothetical protein